MNKTFWCFCGPIALMKRILYPTILLLIRGKIGIMTFFSGSEHFNEFVKFKEFIQYNHGFFVTADFDANFIMMSELVCSIFIMMGLGSRYCATLLVIIALVVSNFTIASFFFVNPMILYDKHFWFLGLCAIIVLGAGRGSLDYYISKSFDC